MHFYFYDLIWNSINDQFKADVRSQLHLVDFQTYSVTAITPASAIGNGTTLVTDWQRSPSDISD